MARRARHCNRLTKSDRGWIPGMASWEAGGLDAIVLMDPADCSQYIIGLHELHLELNDSWIFMVCLGHSHTDPNPQGGSHL